MATRLSSFSARLGRPVTGDLFSAQFAARDMLRLTEEISGYFRSGPFYRAVADAHVSMAAIVQEEAVRRLRASTLATGRPQLTDIPRPGRAANRLATSIMDEQNRDVTASGFMVGRPAWLEQSPAALYYRIIEEGGESYQTSGLFFSTGKAEKPRTGVKTAIKLSQRPMPFSFTVSATPAYHMMEDAGRWFRDQKPLQFSLYRDKLTAQGMPVPLRAV